MSKFLANVLKLGSATLLGQIIGFIVTPVLSRLYSPADFGIYQLFISIVTFIAIISCLSYHGAINLPKKHEDGASIVTLCILLIAITSVVATIFFFVFSGSIGQILNAPRLSNYLFLVPLAILCNSVAFVLAGWLSRKEEFGTMAKANLVSSITGKSVSVGSGIISPSPFGLIFGTITNDATIVIISLKKTVADFHLFQNVSYERIKEIAIRYKNFPRYNAPSSLTSTAGVQSTPLLLAFFFSPVVVGYYAMAHLVINLPLRLVGNSLASVFFQKACVEKNLTGSVKNIVKTVHTRLISIGMFASLIIMIIGPELFIFFFGERWYTAGVYAQILMPWFFVVFISVPLVMIYSVLEMQNINLWYNVVNLISRIVVLVIGGILGDPVTLMILLSSTGVVSWSWMNMYTLKIAGVELRGVIYEIIRYLLFGLFMCLPLIIAKYYAISSTMLVLMTIVISVIYYLIIIYRDTQLKEGLLNFVGNILNR
jgi:O-antigen/teichoic acid export membrane protein